MSDIRRTLLWFVFSISLVMLWDSWGRHHGQPSMFGLPSTQTVTAAPPAPALPPASVPVPTATGSNGVPTAQAQPGTAPDVAAPAAVVAHQQVSVTTDLVKATFDSEGGSLVRLELTHFLDDGDKLRNMVLFDQSAIRNYSAQTGLITAGGSLPNHRTEMTLMPGETALKDSENALTVVFESPTVGGVKVVKTWTLHRGSYVIDVDHRIVNEGTAPVTPQLYLQLVRDGGAAGPGSSFYSTFTGPAVYTPQSKFKKIDFKNIEKGDVQIDKSADDGWIAMVQHYFATAWLIPAGQPREFLATKLATNLYAISMVQTLATIAPGANIDVKAQLFAGPQEEKKLEALAPGLDLVKDYGWFTIISKPLFWLLTQLHALIGNWGWAIVALVVLLKAAFYGLNASAYKSMAKMKAVNPKITELRERLKDKPQQLQQEMMRIYKEEKVNPFGGCLPIFVQMPFFIALYWVLLSTVEMRNAPWIGWISDLSAKDPYFILPLLMTGTSLLQTWLNPKPADPMQARMMWLMPLVFSVMFFFFPAGLVLYWLTNNILSIAQQWVINKRLGVLGK